MMSIECLKRLKKIMWAALAIVFLFGFALGGVIAFLTKIPNGAIVRGVTIGPFDVGGLTLEQAAQLLSTQTAAMEDRGIVFKFGSVSTELASSIDSAINSELSITIFKYAPESALDTAVSFGRSGSWWKRAWERTAARLAGKSIHLEVKVDSARVQEFLRSHFEKFEKPFEETTLTVVKDNDQMPQVKINPGKPGMMFDYVNVSAVFARHLAQFDYSPVTLKLATVSPQITPRQAQEITPSILALLDGGGITLRYGETTFVIKPAEYAEWFDIALKDGKIVLVLREDKARKTLASFIASFEQPVQESRFKMVGDRVMEFQTPRDGRTIDMQYTLLHIEKALFSRGESVIEVTTIVQKPTIDASRTDELGIKDLLGTATTRFTGSPKNRRSNIAVGAASLNGLLIAPGEEFSVVGALGAIDKTKGYLPELVIKENKTTPEFGGGLCQVSTTVFRSVLDSGLPVTERSNHAYRVSYYEPAGKDATIYSPKPDFKFVNDTAHYILIQTRVMGDTITVELWGTKDGRAAWQSDSRIYNIVPPPEAKLVETTDISVGVKKCTEKAHSGADAIFTYAITYSDGRINKRSFFSRYKPWREVCLVGVEKQKNPSADEAQGP